MFKLIAMATTGRPKCGVWKFYSYCKDKNSSKCSVVILLDGNEERLCGKEFKGRYATNLRKHLKTCHQQEYKTLEAEENEKRVNEDQAKSHKKLTQSTL